jgi:DNA-binding CsgD family transcriptional regulator
LNQTRNVKRHSGRALELSPREREVLGHFATGFTYAQIANRLGISPHTVDTYLRRVREKTGAGSGAELTRLAVVLEMLDGDRP